jgi:hypothetical protein
MSLFGPLLPGSLIENAAIDTLKAWMPAYIAELERQAGRDARSLPMIKSWVLRPEFEVWPEDLKTPAIVAVSPGLAEPPTKNGDGSYDAVWSLGVGVVTETATEASTRELARVYAAAIRGCILQRRSLGAGRIADWVDESYDEDIPAEKARTLACAMNVFTVQMDNVVLVGEGPRGDPPEDPYADPGDWPEVQTTHVEIERL